MVYFDFLKVGLNLVIYTGAAGVAHPDLVNLHVLLLRKIRLPKMIISKKNWEKALGRPLRLSQVLV